jgi:hypothetical protein
MIDGNKCYYSKVKCGKCEHKKNCDMYISYDDLEDDYWSEIDK